MSRDLYRGQEKIESVKRNNSFRAAKAPGAGGAGGARGAKSSRFSLQRKGCHLPLLPSGRPELSLTPEFGVSKSHLDRFNLKIISKTK